MVQIIPYKKNTDIRDLKPYAIYREGKVFLEFDTIIESGYQRSVEITDYPFESKNGQTRITEYMYNNPDIITMKGIRGYESLVVGFILKKAGLESAIDLIKQQLNILISGIYKLQIMTRSGLRKYFTLQKYYIPENLDNFTCLEVEMQFKQVITKEDWDEQQKNIEDINTVNGGNLATNILTNLI